MSDDFKKETLEDIYKSNRYGLEVLVIRIRDHKRTLIEHTAMSPKGALIVICTKYPHLETYARQLLNIGA